VAHALGVESRGTRPIPEAIAEHIGNREVVVVIDNCDHLIGSVAELISHVLQKCPSVRAVATSREPLRITGEVLWQVGPLEVPASSGASAEQVCQSPAVQLFAERARAANSEFELTQGNAAGVADICRRLDGLPLAIELAAARVSLLAVEQIGGRLREPLELLVGAPRDAARRHQALRTTVEWSYSQLGQPERSVFDTISVFAGGFTAEAAESLCAREELGGSRTLDVLGRLVDKSLLVVVGETAGRARYGLLETLRAYALERLDESGKLQTAQHKHAAYFLDMTRRLDHELTDAGQRPALARLEAENANINAALEWAVASGNHDVAMQFGATLWRYWRYHAALAEGDVWLGRLMSLPGPWTQARLRVVFGAAMIAMRRGELTAARRHFECIRSVAQELGDDIWLASAETQLAFLSASSDPEGARVLHENALSIRRGLGRTWEFSINLMALGTLADGRGDKRKARELASEALDLTIETGDDYLKGEALRHLAMLDYADGRLIDARARLAESLEGDRRLGMAEAYLLDAECLAVVVNSEGRPGLALQLFAATRAERERIGSPRSPGHDMRHALETARQRLGDREADRMWRDGAARPIDWALERVLDAPLPARPPQLTPTEQSGTALSSRELQVLRLIVDAKSNRDIATALVISEHTVVRHVANIFGKLGIMSRTGAAAFALRNRLV
jgi:non-specific serine/threonine protein kinase